MIALMPMPTGVAPSLLNNRMEEKNTCRSWSHLNNDGNGVHHRHNLRASCFSCCYPRCFCLMLDLTIVRCLCNTSYGSRRGTHRGYCSCSESHLLTHWQGIHFVVHLFPLPLKFLNLGVNIVSKLFNLQAKRLKGGRWYNLKSWTRPYANCT